MHDRPPYMHDIPPPYMLLLIGTKFGPVYAITNEVCEIQSFNIIIKLHVIPLGVGKRHPHHSMDSRISA